MRVCVIKIVSLQNRTDQLCIAFEELVEHFAVIDVIAAARTLSRHRRVQQLALGDRLDVHFLIKGIDRGCV